MKITPFLFAFLFFFASCQQNPKETIAQTQKKETQTPPQWTLQKTIPLEGISPIGIAKADEHFWISDGDHNRLIHLNKEGKILAEESNFERPMHIAYKNDMVYIPSYGADEIIQLQKDGKRTSIAINDSLDAPAGVDVLDGNIAIADFYNHRILLIQNGKEISIGKKGKADGEFHYPTDVQLTKAKIYVADAYNNRVQVFDKTGKHLLTFGKEHKMNAATGIYVTDKNVFVTDFENDRVLIFDLDGQLEQIIENGLEKPTDLLVDNDLLYIINYKSQKLTIFGQ